MLKDTDTVSVDRSTLIEGYTAVRALSLELCEPLEPEDYRVQSMPDVSPPWWNLGHTSWFFAKNILEPRAGYTFSSQGLEYVLNSYYETHGRRVPRHERGIQSRPTTAEILAFREEVDGRMIDLISSCQAADLPEVAFLVTAGIQHEQQHQELLVTEIKHILGTNAPSLRPAYVAGTPAAEAPSAPAAMQWTAFDGGVVEIGHLGEGWCWDNELPVHRRFVEPFAIADRLVTVAEYLEFVHDGGYERPLLWMSNGWQRVGQNAWKAPLYWEETCGAEDGRTIWTLTGQRSLRADEPVCHVSYYEADAFANWLAERHEGPGSIRLPTEAEWELAARSHRQAPVGSFLDDRNFHPRPAPPGSGPRQLLGDLWEWTSSHYEPYPGYRPFDGHLSEYNGKFMDNQRVLRGGSCATPRDHLRVSYRNFWPAETRFQFTGIRLARSP